MATCEHCGTPFSPAREDERFCCKGCECVHDLIHSSGHDRFYELRRDAVLAPVKGRPFEEPELDWLDRATTRAEEEARELGRPARLDCRVEGLSCVACVWLVERLFERQPGAIRAVSNPARGSLRLEWRPGEARLPEFARELISFGYTPVPAGSGAGHREDAGLAARTGLCFAFALNAMGFSLPVYLGMPDDFEFAGLFRLIAFISATLSMLVGGAWFITRAWRALRARSIHIDLPIALGLIAAYLGSIAGWITGHSELLYFDFVSTFVFLMLGGRWLQTLAIEKNRGRMARRSPVASRYPGPRGEVALEELGAGDEFDLSPGKALPVTATLGSDRAEVSLEWIHGEPDPVPVTPGTRLPAGAILLSRQPARFRADETWSDSLLSRLTAETANEHGSPGLQRILRGYLAAVIVVGVAGFIAWLPRGGTPDALQVMISIFVVSCPCALGVAIPFADERATQLASRAGVFVRRSTLWSRLRRVRQLVFDKTGTLTLERPVLDNPEALGELDDDAARALATLTSGSCHPLARTLLEALGSRGQKLLAPGSRPEVREQPGFGAETEVEGRPWSLGRPGWRAAGPEGATVLARGHTPVASFRFHDSLRPDARAILDWARRRGLRLHLLSGDHPEKVARFADALGFDPALAHGGLSPDDKASRLRQLGTADTLYLGDGANDSLAFDHALVTGTPVADRSLLEQKADFFTLGSGLAWLPELFGIAASRSAGIRRAFAFTLAYNLAAVAICLAGAMNPLLAAILMPLSSIGSLALVSSAKLARSAIPVHPPGVDPTSSWENPPPMPSASSSAC